jgi:parallel beta-helix repeat protein
MKKLLILTLVLGMASAANAVVGLSVDGVNISDGTEYIPQNTTIELSVVQYNVTGGWLMEITALKAHATLGIPQPVVPSIPYPSPCFSDYSDNTWWDYEISSACFGPIEGKLWYMDLSTSLPVGSVFTVYLGPYGASPTSTIDFTVISESYASAEFPADGEVITGEMVQYLGDDYIWTKLIFVPGATAIKHTGYFSDDYSKVESRAQDANLGQPPYAAIPGWEYTFFAGNPQVPPADDTLVRERVYYWCVDETDTLGTTYPGDIWEFGVQGFKAFAPSPPNEAVISGPDVLLSWLPGFGVEKHDVYIGTVFDDVNNVRFDPLNPPPEYLGTVSEPNISVTSLAFNTTYYWRVDQIIGRMPPPLGGGAYYYGDVWSFTTKTAGPFSGSGSGTAADPYIITNVNQLQEMQNDLTAYYELGNDIDASGTVSWNGGEGFVPVGIATVYPDDLFTGTFDGMGHSIGNLYINRIDSEYQGLFGYVFGATIRNVHLSNANIAGDLRGGTLAGKAGGGSIITKCSTTGTVTLKAGTADSKSGGFIGSVVGACQVQECFSGVNVNADNRKQVGGLIGYLIGRTDYTLLSNSYSTGTVTGGGSKQGNLVGDADGSYVDKCYSSGNGKALIGNNFLNSVITNSYWDKDKGASSSTQGGTPKTTAEMMQQATFTGWDFAAIWDIEENLTYPFLRFEDRVSIGPVAHWKLDEGGGSIAYDSVGTSDGTIYGAAWTTGLLGGALDFDGDDYVETSDDSSLRFTQYDSFSICSWLKPVEGITHSYITCKMRASGQSGYFGYRTLAGSGPKFGFSIEKSMSGEVVIYTGLASSGEWHHVTAVYDNTDMKIYLDGELKNTDTFDLNTGSTAPDKAFTIGARSVDSLIDTYFDGAIDDVRVYERALSTVEIEELYNSVPVPPVVETYHVDGATGDNTNDGLTRGTAFATIQRGINAGNDGDTILVWPGVYNEEISFLGEAITVKSAADAAVVETNHGYAFSFFSAEEPNTILSNFVIRNSQYGIYLINGASPTLRNLTIVNNDFGISAYNGSDPDISNCILWNNYYGNLFRDPVPLEAKYSWVGSEVKEPIAHWKFNEGSGTIAYDSKGTNDGTVNGATWATGQLGGTLNFDGNNDYVDMIYPGPLGNSPRTITAWAKTSSSSQQIMFSYGGTSLQRGSTIRAGISAFGCQGVTLDISYGVVTYSATVADGKWHHYAYIVPDKVNAAIGDVELYQDGVLLDNLCASAHSSVINTASTYAIEIGRYTSDQTQYFNGTIDDVLVYGRALSAEEVQRIYQKENLADPGFVDANNGDYHLLSERGRYWPAHDVWVLDDVTSPCIDGGDPDVSPYNERMPNGGRINMGAYGNTAYASMSEWPLKHDSNFDGVVNMLDLAELALEWLEGDVAPSPSPPPLPSEASNPSPADGATGVSTNTDLGWTPGSNAVSHDVYFGASSPPAFRGNQIVAIFDTGAMSYNTTYYWRVDEVNATGITTSTVWTFTTASGPPPPPPM